MKNILVSGASGIVGYGVLRTLRKSECPVYLIGSTIYGDSVAQGFCDTFEKAPLTSDKRYLSWLVEIIEKYKVDMIIPGIEADMYCWMANKEYIQRTGVKILLNNTKLVNLCQDKWLFYQALCEAKMSCAIDTTLESNFESLVHRFGLPFLLKPRCGFGSKGIVKVHDKKTFLVHQQGIGEHLMVQPIVGSDEEEYTVSAFCDGRGGFAACMALRRKLSKDGFTEKAETVEHTRFVSVIEGLCRVFEPVGPTNFQFRASDSGIKLLEINPRVSSSTSIREAFGYNESAMAIQYFLEGKEIEQPTLKKGKAVRYTEDYIYYEDSIHI